MLQSSIDYMLSSKYPIPESSGHPESSVAVSIMVFHMVFLQWADKRQIEFGPEMEIIMKHIIES